MTGVSAVSAVWQPVRIDSAHKTAAREDRPSPWGTWARGGPSGWRPSWGEDVRWMATIRASGPYTVLLFIMEYASVSCQALFLVLRRFFRVFFFRERWGNGGGSSR